LMAEEILDERATTIDIDPLRYARFAGGSAGATSDASAGEYNVV